MNITTEHIATRLKELRNNSSLSQTEVASSIGIDMKAYQHYEYARCFPPIDVLFSLCKLYCYDSIDELLFGEKSNRTNNIIQRYKALKPDKKKIVDFVMNMD